MWQGTATGLADAYDIFDAGIEDPNCPDCRTDRELVLLRAITEAAILFLDHGDVLAVDDLLDLADGFGVGVAVRALDGVRSRNLHEPIGPEPLPREADPNHVRRVLDDSIPPRLESIIAELDSIEDAPAPFVMYMSPEETGLTGDLEIDYGDVLILRGLFLAYRGLLEAQIACDGKPYVYEGIPDGFSFRETVPEGNLLIEWARRLAGRRVEETDAYLTSIRQARQDWIDAITCYMDALEYIALEDNPAGTDPQEDELTYIDATNLPHLDVYVNVLVTLRGYLQRDMAGSEPSVTTRTYDVHDSEAAPLGELVLLFDGARFEGRRGQPRLRPPFPAVAGLYASPTVINNVESIAPVPSIIHHGAEWFANIGTPRSPGTAIFALTGKVNNTGLVEVPMGITLGEIIFDIGGGVPDGKTFKAVQTGGPLGGCIPAEQLNVQVDFDSLKEVGAVMGSGGMIVVDEDTCMVEFAKFFLTFATAESCGKCIPCRMGGKRMLEVLTRITEGNGRLEDLETLRVLAQGMETGSLCSLGQLTPGPVLAALRYFEDEFRTHIVDKRCPAGACKELVRARCTNACPADVDVPSYVSLVAQGLSLIHI